MWDLIVTNLFTFASTLAFGYGYSKGRYERGYKAGANYVLDEWKTYLNEKENV